MSSTYAIQSQGLRKEYGKTIAVRGLNLDVPRGEVFGFLGPNGAGKTTSLKMFLGLVAPTSGTAEVLGQRPSNTAMRSRLGFLPEHFRFHEWLSGQEFLRLHGSLHSIKPAVLDRRIDELLELVSLTDFRARQLHTYSKGMLQRIGLAQALLNHPELVFLDEPTSGLDPVGRRMVRDIIRSLKAEGTTVFLNSHLLSEVEITCDRVAFIKFGEVLRVSSLSTLVDGETTLSVRVRDLPPECLNGLSAWAKDIRQDGDSLHMVVLEEELLTGDKPLPGRRRRAGLCILTSEIILGRPVYPGRRNGRRIVNTLLVIAQLTFKEAIRRRIAVASLVLGGLFLLVFNIGFHFITAEIASHPKSPQQVDLLLEQVYNFLHLAAMYAGNFMVIVFGTLITADTISGEINSGVVQVTVTKPITRWQYVIGKWLGNAGLLGVYMLLLDGGSILGIFIQTGYSAPHILEGMGLLYLNGLLVMTLALALSSSLSTLATGGTVFGLFGVAFIGGWVERIGSMMKNQTAMDLGISSSLLMPSEAIWNLASNRMTNQLASSFGATPFSFALTPSPLMIAYTLVYLFGFLSLAVWNFTRRDL